MDADAPPLVRADTLASQGEQLASRKAYQQALTAHTEAAKNYQLAAQATSDTTAAKALLLQRDKQSRLASEVRRKIESRTGNVSSRQRPTQPQASIYAQPHRERDYPSARRQHAIPEAHLAASNVSPFPQSSYTPRTSNPYMSHYVPRERIEASNLAESRYSRKPLSPSASQISNSTHPSGDTRGTDSVEESYYLLRNDSETDPKSTFLNMVSDMVEKLEIGTAVAFASLPLEPPPAPVTSTEAVTSAPALPKRNAQNAAIAVGPESFYVVPSQGQAVPSSNGSEHNKSDKPLQQSGVSNKTREELLHENATLKETLDVLSRKFEWMTKERQRDRDALMGSVTLFARDVRKQAERVMGQSVANLAETRRNIPMSHSSAPPSAGLEDPSSSQRRIQELQDELKVARLEIEKQAARAQQYKSKYDDLRTAILEKRKMKAATAASAASASATKAENNAASKSTKHGEDAATSTGDTVQPEGG